MFIKNSIIQLIRLRSNLNLKAYFKTLNKLTVFFLIFRQGSIWYHKTFFIY